MSELLSELRDMRTRLDGLIDVLSRGHDDYLMEYEAAAKYLDISEAQLRVLIGDGELHVVEVGKRGVRIAMSELRRYVAAHTRRGAA